MAETRASIEERLSQLVQENSETTCWEKTPVKIFAIVSFVAFAGVLGVCIYFFAGWQIVNKDLQGYKDKIKSNNDKVHELNKTHEELTAEIKVKSEKIIQLDFDIKAIKKNITKKSEDVGNITAEIENVNNTINTTQKNLEDEKGKHNGLVEEDKRVQKELDNITHVVDEIKAKVLVVTKQLSVWKLLSGIGFFGSALAAFGGFTFTGELAAANRNIAHLTLVEKAFPALSQARENYVYLSRQQKQSVTRGECYRWKVHGSISNCFNHPNLITTVLTNTGYRFGIVTTVPWTDKIATDENAYAFSSHYALTANMRPQKHISVTANSNALNFGEKELLLDLNTGKGSTDIVAFNNPIQNNTFFTPEPTFVFDELSIEIVDFKQES